MHVMYIAGIMSGTSLDGIDVALVHIEGSGIKSKVELIHFTTVPFCDDNKKGNTTIIIDRKFKCPTHMQFKF